MKSIGTIAGLALIAAAQDKPQTHYICKSGPQNKDDTVYVKSRVASAVDVETLDERSFIDLGVIGAVPFATYDFEVRGVEKWEGRDILPNIDLGRFMANGGGEINIFGIRPFKEAAITSVELDLSAEDFEDAYLVVTRKDKYEP